MAAKKNARFADVDVTLYDWVGMGVVNPASKIKTPPCGLCHPGGGPSEVARDPDTGLRGDQRYDDAEAAGLAAAAQGGYVDGDFATLVNGGGASHWAQSGVAEADCLMCHLEFDAASGKNLYNFSARFKQLTYRNYKWAATAGAGLGTVSGKVFTFDENTATGYLTGTFLGAGDALPTVAYAVSGNPRVAQISGTLYLNKAAFSRRPAQPTRDIYCLFCHESSDTKKRGFEWSGTHDVHAAKDVHCLDCHGMHDEDGDGKALEHQIGKGFGRLESARNDLDGTMKWDCAGCHLGGQAPNPAGAHGEAFGNAVAHTERISCEGCHIPRIDWNQGYLIDMSSGRQIWTLSDGSTPTWADEFQKAGTFRPFLKKFDQDGAAGPRPTKYFPFGAKSSAWFGTVYPNGEIQPIFLRHVTAAYNALWPNNTGPKVKVLTVPDDLLGVSFAASTQLRPSVFADADLKAMIERLEQNLGLEEVVFVTDVVKGLDGSGNVVQLDEFDAESCHDFSINHDTKPAEEALGAGGCTDCHAAGGALYNPQVREVTTYLSDRADRVDAGQLADPEIAKSMASFAGFDAGQEARLLREIEDPADPADVHPDVVSYGQNGANTCAFCHEEAVAAFKATVHYSSRSAQPNENFFFPGGGKHGMLDRACALVGSNMLLNMLTTAYTDRDTAEQQGGQPAQQCGSCHANYYNTLLEGFVALQAGEAAADSLLRSGIDCLVCHAEQYDFVLRTTYEPDPSGLNAGFGTIGGVPQRIRQDRSFEAVDSIVGKPTDDMCLRCHEHARTDYKRGELPEPEYDIHYKLGVSGDNPCLFCHPADDHKFNRGILVNGDIFASDYPVNSDANDTQCANCHTDRPHGSTRLNGHVEFLACETCHITATSGAETTIWADGGFLALAKKDGLPRKLYTKKEGSQRLTPEELFELYKQRPIYMPFSGLTSFLAQPIPVTNQNPLALGKAAIEPKVFPFKTIINPMPFDGRFFGVGVADTDQDDDGVNDYSMFAAMRMFQDQYKALGFMDADFDFSKFTAAGGMLVTTVPSTDPSYPSYAAMAQMAQFPNLLFFDKYTFGYNWYQDLQALADEGKITRWDYDSETDQGRPLAVRDMKKAVAVGMARLLDMMLQMGFDPGAFGMTAEQMKGMYASLSDDQLITMAAPPGSEMQAMLSQMPGINPLLVQNYPAYSNGVTLGGHGVQKEEALFCADCHDAGKSVFNQKVEVPTYGPNRMPLFHWEFFDQELLGLAEQGTFVEDVEAEGYLLKSGDFEMGVSFVTATQAAAELAAETGGEVTFGKGGRYLAVLTPTTRLATNWAVLGYSEERVAELTGQSPGGDGVLPGDVESGSGGSSECFVGALGAEAGGLGAWVLGVLGALGATAAGMCRRR